MIKSICCVCKKQYGEREDGREKIMESHGYCQKCLAEAMKEINEKREELKSRRLRAQTG